MKYLAMLLVGVLLAAGIHVLRMTEDERARILQAAPAPAPAPAPAQAQAQAATPPQGIDSRRDLEPTAIRPSPPRPPTSATGPAPPPAAARPAVPSLADAPVHALPSDLVVPVQGVAPSELSSTFHDDRGEGRVHEALDIMAPAGTPVLAVADGHVEKLFDSERGGLTIYQFEPAGRLAYYYAHLERYAPGLAEGQGVRQGDVIGYVGSSGNADPAAPHLHFAIFLLGPEKRWWEGTAIDPWPLLSGSRPSEEDR